MTESSENQPVQHALNVAPVPYITIRGDNPEGYEEKVIQTYADSPAEWRKVLGENLLFQFGIYDEAALGEEWHSAQHELCSLDKAGLNYLNQQLSLASLSHHSTQGFPRRILDIGCGWGFILKHLAERFPDCQTIDGINVSQQQLNYCHHYLTEQGVQERINLYLCNAQDIDLIPDNTQLYDLVVMRGVISHFSDSLFETVMKKLWHRTSADAVIIISDNLYNVDLSKYKSDMPDIVDRLACKHRKTPEYFYSVLQNTGFTIHDRRVLPDNADAIRWLSEIHTNIDKHFPTGANGALEELYVMAENLIGAIKKNKFSIYSTILKRSGR